MKIRRKQRETRAHAPKWALLVVVLSVCFVAFWGVKGAFGVMESWTEDLPSVENSDAFNYAEKSVMYAADGTTVLAEFQLENRDPLDSLDAISPYVVQGTVATEDVRFYEHNGVDLMGIARALVNNLTGGSLEGASTITQQLVRNTILSEEATDISIERKIREAELALDMEEVYSKDEILLMYLNTINYGNARYGIQEAAHYYFQKSASDLTLAEAATLVGIPQSPTYLNPLTNPDACQTRRNTVLDRMLTNGVITQEEHDAAQAEPLVLNPAPEDPTNGIYAYPYFTDYVRQWVLSNYDNADVFEGGWTIYTTLDVEMQDKAEAACNEQNASMNDALESSLVAIDPSNGHVLAMVGGKDYSTNQFNTAAGGQGVPTGSSFKTFTLAAAIEQGINPATLVDCTSPMKLADGTSVENFGNINYGIRSIERATAVSSNTGFIRLVEEIGPSSVIEMAHRLGVEQDLPEVKSITLGTGSVTPLEMASAYATIAAGGVKHDPVTVTKIVDHNGNVIYEPEDTSDQVISAEVAGAVTKVLRTVFETTEGTAYSARLSSGQPVAGKTGTSEDYHDHWLVGYSPTLVCATWIGDRSNRVTSEGLDCNSLWRNFMSAALEDQQVVNFPTTSDPKYDNKWNDEQNKKLKEKSAEDAPDVSGMTLDQAAEALDGYEAEYIEQYSDTVPAGSIISQSVVNGKVRLVVSKGPDPNAGKTEGGGATGGDEHGGGSDAGGGSSESTSGGTSAG